MAVEEVRVNQWLPSFQTSTKCSSAARSTFLLRLRNRVESLFSQQSEDAASGDIK